MSNPSSHDTHNNAHHCVKMYTPSMNSYMVPLSAMDAIIEALRHSENKQAEQKNPLRFPSMPYISLAFWRDIVSTGRAGDILRP